MSKWGLSSAGRAPALQAGGHRFDPDTLHHSPHRFDREAHHVCFTVQSDELTSYREIKTSVYHADLPSAADLGFDPASMKNEIQVKYTNRVQICMDLNHNVPVANQRPGRENSMLLVQKKPVFFWIKSSAKRAFGGCLGSKRR